MGPTTILGLVRPKLNFLKGTPIFSFKFNFINKFYLQIGIIDGTLGQFLVGILYVQRDVPMCELVADWPYAISGPTMNKLRSHL